MRLVLALVPALLVALPLSVSAQDADQSAAVEPSAEEPVSLPEPAPEEPALQLKLDDAGVAVVPPPPTSVRLGQVERAITRHRGGLIASSVVLAFGVGLVTAGAILKDPECSDDDPACISTSAAVLGPVGTVLVLGGLVGMAVKGAKLANSKRELRRLQEAHYGTPRRVQWDLARSRLVF